MPALKMSSRVIGLSELGLQFVGPEEELKRIEFASKPESKTTAR
jgi:hypothetical protein